MPTIEVFDTTLRDGAQREGISFTLEDKLKIAARLDEIGVHYIEGGWPGSNPKDMEFFRRARERRWSNATIVAFGATRHKDARVEDDLNLAALLEAGTKAVAIVGKSSEFHAVRVLETTPDENVRMVAQSIRYLCDKGLTVLFDAEHFFDGFRANAEYALRTVAAAAEAGADTVVLCDTNGGAMTWEVEEAVRAVRRRVSGKIGVHMHNDAGVAVANSLAAIRGGAVHVQGTINGYGERCGNANLCAILPALNLKMGMTVIAEGQLARLTELSHFVSEVANLSPDAHQPYVGQSAFAHKGGIHVSAFRKVEASYQHIAPEAVGNSARVLVSELAGRSSILLKAKEYGFPLLDDDGSARHIVEHVKKLESQGFQFEGAEESFELLVLRRQPDYRPPFHLVDFLVLVEKRRAGDILAEAMVKIRVGEETYHTAAEGIGPVNALDAAMRKALLQFYPTLADVRLLDYKVRILDEEEGTASIVRVLIESGDGQRSWSTVGSSPNIIEASWLALADSLEYALLRRGG